MIKALLTLAIAFTVYFLGKSIYTQYQAKERREKEEKAAAEAGVLSDGLTGMPANFEPSLQAAQAQGAASLKAWLDRYRPYIRDPKLGAIELDYANMLARSNPAEAKRIYQAVRNRTPQSSPIYPRVKRLEATFGR